MNNKYTAIDIANYIIWYVNNNFANEYPLTPLKLQKILYYVHASFLVKNEGNPLFKEKVEKWQYGPVVREVYFEFKAHGTDHIHFPHSVLAMIENDKGVPNFEFTEFCERKIESDVKTADLIKDVVDKLIICSPFDLVEKTHLEPMWSVDKTKILAGERGLIYDNAEITEYFKQHPII